MNKYLKDMTFTKVFFIWFALFFLLLMINMQTLKNSLLVSITGAALGVFLLIFPIPPHSFQRRYGKEQAVRVTRILALAIIVVSFISKVQF